MCFASCSFWVQFLARRVLSWDSSWVNSEHKPWTAPKHCGPLSTNNSTLSFSQHHNQVCDFQSLQLWHREEEKKIFKKKQAPHQYKGINYDQLHSGHNLEIFQEHFTFNSHQFVHNISLPQICLWETEEGHIKPVQSLRQIKPIKCFLTYCQSVNNALLHLFKSQCKLPSTLSSPSPLCLVFLSLQLLSLISKIKVIISLFWRFVGRIDNKAPSIRPVRFNKQMVVIMTMT